MKNGKKLGRLIKKVNIIFEGKKNLFLQDYGITGAQMDVLFFLEKQENRRASQKEIVEYLGTSYATVSGIVKRLAQKNFVNEVIDQADKRIKIVELSEQANDLFKLTHNYLETIDISLTNNFTPDEEDTLIYLLEKLLLNANK